MLNKFIANLVNLSVTVALLSMSISTYAGNNFNDEINAVMKPWANSDAPGAAIAVRIEGQSVFERGYGLANLEYDVPMRSDTPTQVGSISKQFTAFAVLQLIDAGKLEFDTNIQTLLPEMKKPLRPILVRHLLDHVSGLRDESTLASMAGWREDDAIVQEQIFNLVAQQEGVNFLPGAEFQYNNSNFLLLSMIVERVSGRSFSDFTQEHIFRPLGMKNSWFADDRFALIKGRAYSYYRTQNGFSHARLNSDVLGSTGLMTTAKDLLIWAENFETKKVGSERVHQWMALRAKALNGDNAVLAKGQEKRMYGTQILWCHGGRIGGFRSFLIRIPERNLSISVLANRSDFDMSKVAYDILAIINPMTTNESSEFDVSRSFDNGMLDAYIGDYSLFKGLVFSFKTVDQALLFSTNQMEQWIPLKRVTNTRFMLSAAENTFIEFDYEAGSSSNSLEYVVSQNGKLRAKRVELIDASSLDVNLKTFEGEYWSNELNTKYVLEVRDNKLYAIHQRSSPTELFISAPNTFDARSNNFMQLEFVTNDGSTMSGMKMSHAVSSDVWFTRLEAK